MHVKSFVVCIVGKIAQGVKVLWVHSHLVSFLHAFVLIQKTFLLLASVAIFVW